ncbi:MAG: hypothetical protein V4623_08940, partial [Pseudomonadota bacterium]
MSSDQLRLCMNAVANDQVENTFPQNVLNLLPKKGIGLADLQCLLDESYRQSTHHGLQPADDTGLRFQRELRKALILTAPAGGAIKVHKADGEVMDGTALLNWFRDTYYNPSTVQYV